MQRDQATLAVVTVLLLAGPAPAAHADIFRCGNTYGTTPCQGGRNLGLSSDPATAANATSAVCVQALPLFARFPDPASVQITRLDDTPKAALIDYAGTRLIVHRFLMDVSFRDRNGAFDTRTYACDVSEASGKVLKIHSFGVFRH